MLINPYYINRRSVRDYSDRQISDRDIELIIDAASHAPSTGNMQLYSVVVTRDPEILRRLAPAHFNQPAFVKAPVVLTFCADFNRFEHWCRLNDAVPGFNNAQSLLSAIMDVSIFAQQVVTIAEQEGLGTCYLGTTAYNAPEIARVLELPDRVLPVLSVSLGYPSGDNARSPRLPVQAIMHRDTYHDYSDSLINEYYQEIEQQPDAAKFINENGKETLAQVFTDVRYPRENNEVFSVKLIDYLRGRFL